MSNVVNMLKAAGLDPIVIDESFDFTTLRRRVKHETNEEFLVRVLNYGCPTGPLIQAFIMEAVTRYAHETAASDETWDNGLINSATWKSTAVWLKAELDKKYKV